jgi:hypothetical protein
MFQTWWYSFDQWFQLRFSLYRMCDYVFLSQRVLVFQANLVGYYWGDVKDLVYTKSLKHSVGYE